jgi:quercetin dioxygenase-like cupin family protein
VTRNPNSAAPPTGARYTLTLVAGSVMLLAWITPLVAQTPGGCNTPVSQRTSEVGCYFTASEDLGVIPDKGVFWHLYNYPTRAAAEAAKGPHGTVTKSFGRFWLYSIAEERWRPLTGERVAVIGPLPVTAGKQYTARYMEAVFAPGMHSLTHRHSGPEAWYVLSGAQCLETSEGIIVARAGEGAVVREGPAMRIQSIGNETRRSVLLVLHDTSRPWVVYDSSWSPKGSCPK